MSTIGIRVANIFTDILNGTNADVKIEGSIHIGIKRGMNFSLHKDCLNLTPLTGHKVVPEITRTTKTTIKNMLTAYAAAASLKGQFEVKIEDACYASVDCELED